MSGGHGAVGIPNIEARMSLHSIVHPNSIFVHRTAPKRDSAQNAADGVLPLPKDNPDGPGAMGRAVKIDNPEPSVKKLIDEGWQKNAFNQYVSDMISVHRTLPDPRDEW